MVRLGPGGLKCPESLMFLSGHLVPFWGGLKSKLKILTSFFGLPFEIYREPFLGPYISSRPENFLLIDFLAVGTMWWWKS